LNDTLGYYIDYAFLDLTFEGQRMLDTITSFATAAAVLVAAWQIRESRKYSQIAFEDSMDQQYRNIAKNIPVDVLLGKNIPPDDYPKVREIVFHYLDLCNEQISLRKRGRISKKRWVDWKDGIEANLQKPRFRDVWEEVKNEAPNEFTDLTRLEEYQFDVDPKRWKEKIIAQ
jgi:hypothetical protein